MTIERILVLLARERQHTLLAQAQAQAARQARQTRSRSAALTSRLRRAAPRPSGTHHAAPAGRAMMDSAS